MQGNLLKNKKENKKKLNLKKKHTKNPAVPPFGWIDLSGCNLMSEEPLYLIS